MGGRRGRATKEGTPHFSGSPNLKKPFVESVLIIGNVLGKKCSWIWSEGGREKK